MTLGLYNRRTAALPHPKIDLSVILIVERAISYAWQIVRRSKRNGFDLNTATEDEITLELHQALYDRVFDSGKVPGFDRQLFSVVVREPKIRNFNYSHVDKMPDLFITLAGQNLAVLRTQYGLFIECKPVDASHPIYSHYYMKGMVRFIDGDYAWTMLNALMVGYVKKGYGPKEFIAALGKVCTTPVTACAASTPISCSYKAHTTTHHRRFKYVETGRNAPDIQLHHLWLKR